MILRRLEFKDDLEEDVFINGLGGRSLKLIAQLVYLADQGNCWYQFYVYCFA